MRSDRIPVWVVCRNFATLRIADEATLLRCAERGRIEPDDYVVNRRSDTCVQAKDMAQLREIFRNRTWRRLARISGVLAWAWRWLSERRKTRSTS